METIDYYTRKSKEVINSDKEISEFKSKLDNDFDRVRNLTFGSSLIDKLRHPIRTIRARRSYKKLKNVKNEFDSLVDADVLQFVDEESGELITDLENSCEYFKPKAIKKYIKTYGSIVK